MDSLPAGWSIDFGDWAYPAVVDWDAAGRNDLLVGTAAGEVWLFRDIGGRDAVRYDRGRAVRTRDGRLNVGSFAAPAPLVDAAGRFTHLLVMSGRGELFAFEMDTATTYVTTDLAKAFGEQNGKITNRYRKGSWWLRKRFAGTRSKQLLTTCRQCRPQDFTEGLTFDELVENVAPEIEVPRPVRGHCEVHVGLYRPTSLPLTCAAGEVPGQVPAGRLQVRTEAEATAELACPDEMSDLPCQEVFMGAGRCRHHRPYRRLRPRRAARSARPARPVPRDTLRSHRRFLSRVLGQRPRACDPRRGRPPTGGEVLRHGRGRRILLRDRGRPSRPPDAASDPATPLAGDAGHRLEYVSPE